MYPAPPTFITNHPGDAWWYAQRDRQWYVVEYTGFAMIAHMQAMLFAGVPRGSRTWDGVTPIHIRIDGNWGPETMRGLYAYARLQHAPDNLLNLIRASGASTRITTDALGIGLWYTFHQPRRVDLMVGPVTGGTRTQRTDPAMLFDVPLDRIHLRVPTTPPVFLSRPNIPEVGIETLPRPIVRAIDAAGHRHELCTAAHAEPHSHADPDGAARTHDPHFAASKHDGGGDGRGRNSRRWIPALYRIFSARTSVTLDRPRSGIECRHGQRWLRFLCTGIEWRIGNGHARSVGICACAVDGSRAARSALRTQHVV